MRYTLPYAALASAVLALTACGISDDDQATDTASVASVESAAPSPSASPTVIVDEYGHSVQDVYILGTPSDLTGQEWADEKIAQWWDLEGANSFAGYMHPYSSIESWESPSTGELLIILEPGAQIDSDAEAHGWGSLAQIADVGAWYLYCVAPDVESITAQTADGSESYTAPRDSVPGETDHDSQFCY